MGMKFVRACESYCEQLMRITENTVGPHDTEKLDAFAKKLCGVGGLNRDQLLAKFKGVTVPAGFHHVQYYNLTMDIEWGTMHTDPPKQLNLFAIIVDITTLNEDVYNFPDLGLWHKTVALPIKRRGVLELGLLYRPKRDSDGDGWWQISQDEWNQNT